MAALTLTELLLEQGIQQATRHGDLFFTDASRIEYIRTMTLGAVAELMEVLSETDWKPWKTSAQGEIRRQAYLLELADVIIFITNLALAVTANGQELADAIRATLAKNKARMKDGY